MKSAVLIDAGVLEIQDRDVPSCGPGDVIVEVEVCGVCRTDLKAFAQGQRDLLLPRVLGHEIIGRIVEVGAGILGFSVCDRVQVYPGLPCGRCDYCRAGNDHVCEQIRILGFNLDGGFAEFLQVPGDESGSGCAGTGAGAGASGNRIPANLNRLPDNLDSRTASLAEPLACSINMLHRLNLEAASTLVIFGAGPLGCLSAQLARLIDTRQIIVVEPHATRRETAASYSDYQLDFNDQTASQIMQLTDGRGADAAITCCPGNTAFEMALEVAAKRGSIGFFSGLTDTGGVSTAALNAIHYRELSLIGAYGCSSSHNREALELLAAGSISIADLTTKDISWQELPQNLASLEPADHLFTFFYPHE